MATRSPSPTFSSEEVSGEALMLTPSSKIRAMMAAIENDSDENSDIEPSARQSRRHNLAAVSDNSRGTGSISLEAAQGNLSEQENDIEEDAIAPRGRLAARLQAQEKQKKRHVPEEENSGSEDAYTRIKKRLLNGTGKIEEKPTSHGGIISSAATVSGLRATSSRLQSPSLITNPNSIESPEKSSTKLDRSRSLSSIPQSDNALPLLPAEASTQDDDDDEELDLAQNIHASNSLKELVTKKRAERRARSAEEERKGAEKLKKRREFEKTLSRDASGSDDNSDNDLAERHLTQSARPTRKASKRALEEMNRETQRMNRNMQLAHQAKTKRKISKDSLLARFNFHPSAISTETIPEHPSSSTITSSAPQSDGEDAQPKDSPPTSPADGSDQPLGKSILFSTAPVKAEVSSNSRSHATNVGDDDLPELADLCNEPLRLEKAKNGVLTSPSATSPVIKKKHLDFKQRPVRVRLPDLSSKVDSVDLDSDSDFEKPLKRRAKVLKLKSAKLDAFHRLPTSKLNNERPIMTLRALANLNSPDDQVRGRKPSMRISDMQMSLQKRARLQALEERKAKINDLKARGILVQTAEEREKDQAEVEDLLEKARREAEELQQKEKRAAKKTKMANGDINGLETSDEDDEYCDDRDSDDADLELSGSDNEEVVHTGDHQSDSENGEVELEGDEEDLKLESEERKQNEFLDDQAEVKSREEEASTNDEDSDDEPRKPQLSRAQRNKITIDDEEDDDGMAQDVLEAPMQDVVENSEARLPTIDIPQFPPMLGGAVSNIPTLGMTQAFAATMAETQGEAAKDDDEEQDSMAFFLPPPEPNLPLFVAENSQSIVPDTQTNSNDFEDVANSHKIDLHFSQSQLQHDTLGPMELQRESTELTEIPDPTQDAGFALSSPAPERFVSVPPSSIVAEKFSTVEKEDLPVLKTRGRLIRGRLDQARIEEQGDTSYDETSALPRDAFKAMHERHKRKAEEAAFNKKKSEAKEMVEEQAMESEDEYAGLGGASDDESGGEEDQDVKAMMDHGDIDVDEGQLAALYANKERASDEKAVERLFKDINNGGLRRKRGADFDLSDSDDDCEARRRRKQREFAKMRKALLADEKVGEIAEDPKKLAFLRAIEDREHDEDLDFLDKPAEDSFRVGTDTQEDGVADSQRQPSSLQATQEDGTTTKQQKRALQEINPNMRPPATARRTAAASAAAAGPSAKKPSTLAEIRESLSFLTEAPGAAPDGPSSSASEDENENTNHHPRRTAASSNPIVDRLILKRASTISSSSSLASSSSASGSRLAFHSTTSSDTFKPPNLFRRATSTSTSNPSIENNNNNKTDKNGISTYAPTERASSGGSGGGGGFRKPAGGGGSGGGRKCSVNYRVREMEMRGGLEVVERRRGEERERRAREGRLGGLLGGEWV